MSPAGATKKRPPTVAIEEELYNRLQERANEKDVPLVKLVNDVLLMDTEKQEFLKKFNPSLYLDHVGEETIFIRDAKKERTAEIALKEGRLVCYLDEQDNCEHVQFALALPELGKLHLKLKLVKGGKIG